MKNARQRGTTGASAGSGSPTLILPPATLRDSHRVMRPTKLEIEHSILYVTRGRRRPAGWVLAHNSVRQSSITFGWFWVADTEHWEVCDCGGRPDKGAHYRIKSPPPVVPKSPIRTDWRNE